VCARRWPTPRIATTSASVTTRCKANRLHLLVECDDRTALARGMISFKTSCAHRLNRQQQRRGSIFADRYHARYLTTPRQVRNEICYVLNNWRHHDEHRARPQWRADRYSSADLFDGWSTPPDWRRPPEPMPISGACTWLLSTGWRRHGLIRVDETPLTAARR
jgi:hypothetical protein